MAPLPHIPLGIFVLLVVRLQQRLRLLHLASEGRDGAEKVYSVHHCLSLHQFHAVAGDLVFHLFKGVESCPVPLQADRHYYHADSGFAGGYPPQVMRACSYSEPRGKCGRYPGWKGCPASPAAFPALLPAPATRRTLLPLVSEAACSARKRWLVHL